MPCRAPALRQAKLALLSARILRGPDPDADDMGRGTLPDPCRWIEDRVDKRLPHQSRWRLSARPETPFRAPLTAPQPLPAAHSGDHPGGCARVRDGERPRNSPEGDFRVRLSGVPVCHWRTPICRRLPIAPSACRAEARRVADPSRLSGRVMRDAEPRPGIQRVRDTTFRVCGMRKPWRQRNREGTAAARCTVSRLGLRRETLPPPGAPRRSGSRTSPAWPPWAGFAPVGAVPGPVARSRLPLRHRCRRTRPGRPSNRWRAMTLIVGWRVSGPRQAGGNLDALERGGARPASRRRHGARPPRRSRVPVRPDQVDRRLAETGIAPSGRSERRASHRASATAITVNMVWSCLGSGRNSRTAFSEHVDVGLIRPPGQG